MRRQVIDFCTCTSRPPHSTCQVRFGSIDVEMSTVSLPTRRASSVRTGSWCGGKKFIKTTTWADDVRSECERLRFAGRHQFK